MQLSLLQTDEKNVNKKINELKELAKQQELLQQSETPDIAQRDTIRATIAGMMNTDRKVIREAMNKMDSFRKEKNANSIDPQKTLPAIEDTMLIIKYALKSMRNLTVADLELKTRFQKIEKKFTKKKLKINANYKKRIESLQGEKGVAV